MIKFLEDHITEHFTLSEFILQSLRSDVLNLDNVVSFYSNIEKYQQIIDSISVLCSILELVRAEYGQAIIITSGYRCPSVNRYAGGVGSSYHLEGRACDLRYTPELASCIKKLVFYSKISLREFIVNSKKSYIHIAI